MKTLSSIAAALLASGLCSLAQGAYTYADATFLSRLSITSSVTNLTSGLIGWWKFDEGFGPTKSDSSGSGYNLTAVGGTPGSGPGILGNASYTSSGIVSLWTVVAGSSTLESTPFTYSAWIWPSNNTDSGAFFGDNAFYTPCFGKSAADIYMSKQGVAVVGFGGAVIPASAWTHVAVSWDGTHWAFYTNGVAASSGTYGQSLTAGSWFYLAGTADNGANTKAFNGRIDDARVYNRVLSAADITYLYHQWYGQP